MRNKGLELARYPTEENKECVRNGPLVRRGMGDRAAFQYQRISSHIVNACPSI